VPSDAGRRVTADHPRRGTIPHEIPDGSGPAPVPTRLLEAIGRVVLRVLDDVGGFFSMMGRVAFWAVRPPYDVPELFRQMVRVGFDSIPVVLVTTLFTGMVLALQTFNGFARFHAENLVGSVVARSLTRELAPVLTAPMVTGRVGGAMAAGSGRCA
jgi:phospholipid/cholesterol/gamma-HCH transport system permease protein